MTFVHEFVDYPSQKNVDNGIWEYENGICYNRFGGHHSYTEHPLNKFFTADSWNDVLKYTIRDDTQITGWLAPDGTFYGCAPMDHMALEDHIIQRNASELENEGWIKIYKNSMNMRMLHDEELPPYDYLGAHYPTLQQKEVLLKKGLTLHETSEYALAAPIMHTSHRPAN